MSRVDRSKRNIKQKGFAFDPFRPEPSSATPLRDEKLKPDVELLAFERGSEENSERRVFTLRDMLYHHVAQGELAGEPYLVTF